MFFWQKTALSSLYLCSMNATETYEIMCALVHAQDMEFADCHSLRIYNYGLLQLLLEALRIIIFATAPFVPSVRYIDFFLGRYIAAKSALATVRLRILIYGIYLPNVIINAKFP